MTHFVTSKGNNMYVHNRNAAIVAHKCFWHIEGNSETRSGQLQWLTGSLKRKCWEKRESENQNLDFDKEKT